MVQKLVDPYAGNGIMEKCTIGVKKFHNSLPDKDKINSGNFAKFITKLRRRDMVALLAKDKYGRFGILRPMEEDPNGEEEKFAADCYVGDMERAQEFCCSGVGGSQTADDGMWKPPDESGGGHDDGGFWKPPGSDDAEASNDNDGFWKPPGADDEEQSDTFGFGNNDNDGGGDDPWGASNNNDTSSSTAVTGKKRKSNEMDSDGEGEETFHKDAGAAEADRFYSGLTRTLDTRSESRLYHMRAFNGWVKATQIQELNPLSAPPNAKKRNGKPPMRVLDLACGKGGDLGKWILHSRKMSNYVGIDVARGSLKDAAVRARGLRNKLERCTFTVADLGSDVPGRLKSSNKKRMQKLLSWSLLNESEFESETPQFKRVRGGGVNLDDKFDVVSIQFAIHYMMQTRKRARRFFRTVSELLEIGGNLIATTIDARVIVERLMDLGEDLRFDSDDDDEEEEDDDPDREIVVTAGAGACRVRFKKPVVKAIFKAMETEDEDTFDDSVFGLQYTFTLKEGSDHAAGVGQAVDLPEWLISIPVLKALAEEAGLELEYALNFHEFYKQRKDPSTNGAAHLALYNMKVLNKNGSISPDEWGISRLYCAVKFRKVREAEGILEDDSDEEDDDDDPNEAAAAPAVDPATEKANQKFLVKAMMKAKMMVGKGQWEALSGDEKKRLTQIELQKIVAALN